MPPANWLCQIQPENTQDVVFFLAYCNQHAENNFVDQNRLLNVARLCFKAKHHAENNSADQNKLSKSS